LVGWAPGLHSPLIPLILLVNGRSVKLRGFCDHSNFGGLGSAVPDRVNLFRAQTLRAVGGNSWRMAHNPPVPARLDYTDALGIAVIDENRDYGGAKQQGGTSRETSQQQVQDMRSLVARDRNRASVFLWSFCNEVGCDNETAAASFRQAAYDEDGTRPVTQNHLGTKISSQYLDVQGFSHKDGTTFDAFHAANPDKPTLATECCSCLSQRGVDYDTCPNPRPGGCTEGCHVDCHGSYKGQATDGEFYNNEISQCTASQINYTDSRDYVSGTFVWSAFDYYGESRGWPQTVKCRGAAADVAGFDKASAGWLRAWWLANIPSHDAGRPTPVADPGRYSISVAETWGPPQGASKKASTRVLHVYSNAHSVGVLVNGVVPEGVPTQTMPFFGTATFDAVPYAPGNLTAVGFNETGHVVATHTQLSAGQATALRLSLAAPNPATGTGTSLVADGEDTAMLTVEVVDAQGTVVPSAFDNVTLRVVSGPGRVVSAHNGDPSSQYPAGVPWSPASHGLVRFYVRSTQVAVGSLASRKRLREIDVEGLKGGVDVAVDGSSPPQSITVEASAVGLASASLSIPVTDDLSALPLAVAKASK